ncbi:(2Fe-2S)-binding protein [Marinicella litoralis]|uniref:Isoquinoline 1-oxidoreductase alpha subunit n=1 Tax=Marinicella litoralis TaxID=644220 RepID=A0A4R6XTZ8_9GAMM|nr:(2Fe-2S)-binding protein [Marinicella litoralis]TDR23266.1 isoquinoline 1-oxidoreductase alpha subunit [Marinicella litoralis]
MIKLNINGQLTTLDVSEDMPLLWALRDVAKLTGSKYGCGKGICGACTVHIDGQAMRSCITPMSYAKDKTITTIEGLSEKGDHPVQQAWQTLNVAQCGYCQTGQIMSASALLANNASPTDDDINNAMAGNICRCGTYPRIRAAIKLAAKSTNNSNGETS